MLYVAKAMIITKKQEQELRIQEYKTGNIGSNSTSNTN